MGLGKGKKACSKCGTITGPRAYLCKKCNTPFAFKNKAKGDRHTKIIHNINWKELQKGDKIKVSGGPYFVHMGEFIPMGYRGKFIVDRIDTNGILAWGIDKNAGFCHIWMNGDIQNKETGVWKTPHKLIKLKQREAVSAS